MCRNEDVFTQMAPCNAPQLPHEAGGEFGIAFNPVAGPEIPLFFKGQTGMFYIRLFPDFLLLVSARAFEPTVLALP